LSVIKETTDETNGESEEEKEINWLHTASRFEAKPVFLKSVRDQILCEMSRMYGPTVRMEVHEQLNTVDAETDIMFENIKRELQEERNEMLEEERETLNLVPLAELKSITLKSKVPKPKYFYLKSSEKQEFNNRRIFARARFNVRWSHNPTNSSGGTSKSTGLSRIGSMSERISELSVFTKSSYSTLTNPTYSGSDESNLSAIRKPRIDRSDRTKENRNDDTEESVANAARDLWFAAGRVASRYIQELKDSVSEESEEKSETFFDK